MIGFLLKFKAYFWLDEGGLCVGRRRFAVRGAVTAGVVLGAVGAVALSSAAGAQKAGAPVVVQPGAPGEPSRTLPDSTRPGLPPLSSADVEFMQGMIMHHSQAV